MRPVHHLGLSAVAATATVPFLPLDPVMTVAAVLLGIAVGVFIDVDHVLLPVARSRDPRGLAWLRHPVRAFRQPDDLLDELSYDRMVFHRLLSHSTVLIAFYLVSVEFPVLVPSVVAIAVHILSDVAWDLSRGTYPDRTGL